MLVTLEQRRNDAHRTWTALRPLLDGSGSTPPHGPGAARPTDAAESAWRAQADLIRGRGGGPGDGPRVVIADDFALIREMLGLLVSATPGLQLVGEAESAWGAVGVVAAEQPDILVLDYELGDADASVVIGHLRSLSPGTRVLLHSAHPDVHVIGRRLGVDLVIGKGAPPKELRAALRRLVA